MGGAWLFGFSTHPTARTLVKAFGPIAATSANGRMRNLLAAQEAGRSLGLPSMAILEGDCPGGIGSTILSVTESDGGVEVAVMREGMPTHSVVEWWKNRSWYWRRRSRGAVARRKLELQPGKTFHEIIESAERFIHRHGGKPAFPERCRKRLAALFSNHMVEGVEGWEATWSCKR